MQQPEVTYYVGNDRVSALPVPPFDSRGRQFLCDLSAAIRLDSEARKFPDLQTFSFWCRAGNIDRLMGGYQQGPARLGRGLAFHIAPSNVPVNAAYTFAFGLLAGNANLVRLPSQRFEQIDILCDLMNKLFEKPEHSTVRDMTAFVRYAHNEQVTTVFSKRCHARVIWGGDDTVREIRKIPLPVRAVELTFSDRYSISLLDAFEVLETDEATFQKLLEKFYNDTYLMDQNACSSPQVVIWVGDDKTGKQAQERFWPQLKTYVAGRYDLQPIQAVDKYSQLLDGAIAGVGTYAKRFDNQIYVVGVDDLEDAENRLRGKFGLFYEKIVPSFDTIAPHVTTKYQTLTYYGLNKSELFEAVIRHQLFGIDRIVPVGRALDIDVIWDGSDLIQSLSRIIDVE